MVAICYTCSLLNSLYCYWKLSVHQAPSPRVEIYTVDNIVHLFFFFLIFKFLFHFFLELKKKNIVHFWATSLPGKNPPFKPHPSPLSNKPPPSNEGSFSGQES